MSDRVQTLLIFMLASLLSIVILAGLVTGELDPTAVALAICTLLGGIVTTLQLRKKPPGRHSGRDQGPADDHEEA